MGRQVLTVELDAYTAERLAHFAHGRKLDVARLAAEALSLFVIQEDQTDRPHEWGPEDLAAIQEGFDQLDRGEGVSQDVVEREIEDLLQSWTRPFGLRARGGTCLRR